MPRMLLTALIALSLSAALSGCAGAPKDDWLSTYQYQSADSSDATSTTCGPFRRNSGLC